ncbi:hypothetical protein [Microvirga sp. G4-2]|uniref:hypothetical protein n=1 Tax=Microvirga sp. G4-2 TaxID=3434467 RepID=UPI004043E833
MWGIKNNHALYGRNISRSRVNLTEIDLKILWVSRTLSTIDYQYEPEFVRINQSLVHKDIKTLMRKALISSYRRKRAPYVKLLAELRSQQRKSSAHNSAD